MSSVNEQLAPPPKPRMSPLEFRNTDLVSRLLAATPPYLYNMSLLPNTYFFSEMLRSFVQAKSDPARSTFQPRRPRKRPWSTMKPETKTESNDWLKSTYPETKTSEPLELTTEAEKPKTFGEPMESVYATPAETASSGLILPPPPPMWYPPLYPTPPYGIDPLHFFIDLRVSGHIYDRKNQKEEKEEKVPLKESIFKQPRHTSAFSVPTPKACRNLPMNLSQCEEIEDNRNGRFDVRSMGLEKTSNKIDESQQSVKTEENETEEEKQKRVKDLRALIGLELVVDYMNHAKPQPRRPFDEHFTDSESAESPTLEVVAVQDEN